MNKKTLIALSGAWAIIVHIGLTRVRVWAETVLLNNWFLGEAGCVSALRRGMEWRGGVVIGVS